jgi:murein DD-endopeptidase MepM/ murein hydrolase activator NlpD
MRRSRRSRLLVPALLGVLAFIGIGSVATGTRLAPDAMTPAGAVEGAIDPAPAAFLVSPAGASAATGVAPLPALHDATGVAPQSFLHDAREAEPDGAPPLAGLTGYRWPLARIRITLPFGPTAWGSRIVDGSNFHDGLDMATFCGDRVMAAHDGIVLAAGRHYDDVMGWLGDLGPYYVRLDAKKLWDTLPIVVVVDDGNGYRSIYAHFERTVVRPGQAVRAGQLLGYEGRTGRASGCHVHYGLFSTFETREFAMDPGVVKRMKVPRSEIARVDPLLVLPPASGAGIAAR